MIHRSPVRTFTQLCLTVGAFLLFAPEAGAQDDTTTGSAASSDTLHVAPPTGERETDRANVQGAFDAVQPGGTVVFAEGAYLVGGVGLVLRTPGVALRGDADGTTLLGCTRTQRRSLAAGEFSAFSEACGDGFVLAAEAQRVSGLRFESFDVALSIREATESEAQGRSASFTGGHVVEDNSFHDGISVDIILDADSTVRVRRNVFRNVWHAVAIVGSNIHVTENDVSVPEPERVPFGFAGVAIGALADADGACSSMIVEGNRIDGHTEAIAIAVFPHRLPGNVCSDITVRDNEIVMRPVRRPDGRLAIAPAIRLFNAQRLVSEGLIEWGEPPEGGWPDALSKGRISDVRVEGNRITGAVGIGIEAAHVTDTRIVGNEIEVRPAATPEELEGLTVGGNAAPGVWVLLGLVDEVNGTPVWVSPGSDGNEVSGNTFEDVAAYAVVVEGDSNRVALDDPADAVRDTGAGNRVDRFVETGGVRLHYLDFGGEGLPVVFVHSEAWEAHTYEDFAPRFTDRNRVLAVTRPGYGASEAHPGGFDVATQARALIDFLDALGIERAVFAGNASATAELTFLGEHHADRLAGLIYFSGLVVPWLEEQDSDPTRAFEMFMRASPGSGDAAERWRARRSYRPEHLLADGPTIAVPALAFVARSGTMGSERGIGALALVGSPLMADVRSRMPPSPVRDHLERLATDEGYRAQQLGHIADPDAREYFLRLAADPELQERMYQYHEGVVLPALRAAQERFRRAFADELRLVRLDVDQIVGYEYRDAPELIEPHIRRFLEEVHRREGARMNEFLPIHKNQQPRSKER